MTTKIKKNQTDHLDDGYLPTNTTNPIIFSGIKRKAVVVDPGVKKKDDTGRKKNKNYALEKEKERITKKRKRQLAAVQARKSKKLTQEELFASLAQYQLDQSIVKQLSSSIHGQNKYTSSKLEIPDYPNKLESLGKRTKLPSTIHQKVRVPDNFYPTDDESSSEEEAPKISTNKSAIEIPDITIAREVIIEEEQAKVKKRKSKNKMLINKTQTDDNIDDEENVANAPLHRISTQKRAISTNESEKMDHFKTRKYFLINRDPQIEEKRSQLPIYTEEVPIIEAINDNIVTIVCGETGSGKTTQIPQFLYEAGYTSEGQIIGITEPRRVAAVSMAQRVGEELNLPDIVSYQIRYEGTRTEQTKILFMTDGILMKEMENDIMLNKYSAIIIDEAHERSMYSDVLIGMLSRIAPLRSKTNFPLKLIIMSATLRLQDFLHKRLFPTLSPKVIKVDARQFPVTVHFEKKTPQNYIAAAFRKTCRIHESLPDGAILIFVSGQQEVRELVDKLKARYPIRYKKINEGELLIKRVKKWNNVRKVEAQNITLEDFKECDKTNVEDYDEEDVWESNVRDEIWDDFHQEFIGDNDPLIATLPPPPVNVSPLYCLPLYSLLSTKEQQRVFDRPPEGTRMCIVTTNVAETSLTIPGVRYVVDTGFEKRRLYDPITGVSQFVITEVSQASADQRAGRAGRIAAGHAYRLYSSAVFQDFKLFSRPEIMDKPADQLVLHLKSMNIVKVVNFPFPTAPEPDVLEAAEQRLLKMGALSVTTKNSKTEARITQLGKTLSVFPLAPAYAKVIAMANRQGLLPYAISLISALSVREPLIPISSLRGVNEQETKVLMTDILKLRRSWCGNGPPRRLGDLLVLLKAVTASETTNMTPDECSKIGIRHKAMLEIRRLRVQLTNIVNTSFKLSEGVAMIRDMPSLTDAQAQMLRQILVAGLVDRIARRVDRSITDEDIPRGAYQTTKLQEYVFIDPCSVVYTEEPDYIIYQEIIQLGDRKCMQTIMTVDHEWLPLLAEPYCNFGEMDKEQEARYDESKDEIVKSVTVSFGPLEWPLNPTDRPIPRDIMLYRFFAMFFLEGQILPILKKYVSRMLAPPSTMIRSWARLQHRTEGLLNCLIDKEVHTKASLIEEFHNNENFLLEEYLLWLPESLHSAITLMWPPIENKAKKMGRNKFYM